MKYEEAFKMFYAEISRLRTPRISIDNLFDNYITERDISDLERITKETKNEIVLSFICKMNWRRLHSQINETEIFRAIMLGYMNTADKILDMNANSTSTL